MTDPAASPETGPNPEAAPPLRLTDVRRTFRSVTAVDGISLELGPHELLALVGPSGSGKSTLLRLIAGLEPLDGGRIEIDGQVVDDGKHRLDPERRSVGMVFQNHELFPHLTVARNVAFGLRKRSRAERDQIVDDLLETVGLAGYRDRYPHEISGGEGQRVALARALAPAPRLLLLDEPFANLDVNLRAQVRGDVVRILRERSTPAVFVTHDQHEAMAIGDRIAVLRKGRLEQLDQPEVVFDQPANRFVAGFVAEAAFLPVHEGTEGLTCELGPVGRPAGAGSLAVVRSSDVTFRPDPDGSATVVAVEFQGTVRTYTLTLSGGTEVRSVQPRGIDAGPGTRVHPSLRDDHRITLVDDDPA